MSIDFYTSFPVGVEGINVCNANAADILNALGLPNKPCGDIAIDPFLGLCRSWLRANIGKTAPALPGARDKEPGKIEVVFFGRREGYLNEKIHALATMAVQAKEQGATHIVWS